MINYVKVNDENTHVVFELSCAPTPASYDCYDQVLLAILYSDKRSQKYGSRYVFKDKNSSQRGEVMSGQRSYESSTVSGSAGTA